MRNLDFSRRTASRYDFKKLIRLKPSTCMVIQEPNGNTWIWPTKASKTIQQITANLIGTATIATTPLKSFAQWYGLKSKESLRLWPLTVASDDVKVYLHHGDLGNFHLMPVSPCEGCCPHDAHCEAFSKAIHRMIAYVSWCAWQGKRRLYPWIASLSLMACTICEPHASAKSLNLVEWVESVQLHAKTSRI